MRRRLVDLAALGSMALAFAVTHFPTPGGAGDARGAVRGVWVGAAGVGERLPDLPDAIPGDKLIHLAIYLLPGALWATSLALRRRLEPRSAALLLAALAAWGALDELTQGLLGRDGEWGDVAANAAGAAAGIALVLAIRRQ